jgi:uncharacterized protein
MPPAVKDNPDEGRFELWIDGELAGFSEYRPAGDSVIVSHTEIDKKHEGEGLASVLVREMLEAIRGRGQSVIPLCQFTAAFIGRNPEFVELVPASLRAQFRPRP